MKKPRISIESISIGLSPSVKIQFKEDVEKNIFQEILIRSADKRFLTSYECCSNCTEHAIESIIEYRKFLVDKLVDLKGIKQSRLVYAVEQIIEALKSFLSMAEQLHIEIDHRYLSEELDTLRQEILNLLYKMCADNKIEHPENLFGMKTSL